MAHSYTENQLVEQPAIGLFAKLGWQTVSALEETFGATGTLLRETKSEVVLVSRLRLALQRLNPARLGMGRFSLSRAIAVRARRLHSPISPKLS